MSFGEKRDDGKTKVPTRSTRNASRLGRKKKERQQQQHGLPRSKTFYTTRKGRVPNATFPLYKWEKGGFYQRHTKTNKARRRPVFETPHLFLPHLVCSPFLSLSLFSRASQSAATNARALASYVLFGSERGITNVFQRDAVPPNLSRRVTEKKRKRKTKNAFRIPLAASPARPGTSNPARSRDAKSLSSADVDRCARVSRVAKKVVVVVVVVRVSSFLSSLKSVSSFLMTQRQKGPPSSKCEKVSAFFFCFFVFFWTKKKSAFFSLFFSLFFFSFFSCCGCYFGLEEKTCLQNSTFATHASFVSLLDRTTPLFCFPTQHLQAHLQEEHQRARGGGSRCFGVVHESSERARGERAFDVTRRGRRPLRARERKTRVFFSWNLH